MSCRERTKMTATTTRKGTTGTPLTRRTSLWRRRSRSGKIIDQALQRCTQKMWRGGRGDLWCGVVSRKVMKMIFWSYFMVWEKMDDLTRFHFQRECLPMHRLRPPWHPSHPGGEKSNSTILKCFFFLLFKGSCDLLEGVNNPLNRISIGHDSWPIEFCSGDYWHFPNIWPDNYLRRWLRTCSLVEISPLLEVDLWSQKLQKLSKQKMAGNVIPKKYFHVIHNTGL